MMRVLADRRAVVSASLAVVIVACGGQSPDSSVGSQSPPAPVPISSSQLELLLPSPAGWQHDNIKGPATTTASPTSHATAVLTRGDASVTVTITDTLGKPEFVDATAKIAGTDFARTVANGYLKGTTIGGYPALESWNHQERAGEITVLLERRLVVHASGTALEDIAALRSVIEAVALPRVAALVKS